MSYTKKGKHDCMNSKGINEEALEGAFVEAYNRFIGGDNSFLSDFIDKTYDYMKNSNLKGLMEQCEERIETNQGKIDKLALAFVDGTLSQDVYEAKLKSLNAEKAKLAKEKDSLDLQAQSESDAITKLQNFRAAALESGGKELKAFSRDVFDTTIDRIIFGGYDKDKVPDPFMVTFIFKKEFGAPNVTESNLDYTILNEFNYLWKHFVFRQKGVNERVKYQDNFIKVRVAISK